VSREHWKKHDRPRPPCPDCGTELYDQFWGNGGWAPAEKATDDLHSERKCIIVLKGEDHEQTGRRCPRSRVCDTGEGGCRTRGAGAHRRPDSHMGGRDRGRRPTRSDVA
jgi:hypothetical protein